MAKHKLFNLLDVATISNHRVEPYEGERAYVATGDLDVVTISGATSTTYAERPSRADLVLNENEVLFAKMKNTVKVLLGSEETKDKIFSTGFYVLKPKENITTKFLYFYLLSDAFNKQKDRLCTGATMSALTNEGLKKIVIDIPLDSKGNPDIKEQERIVALLEEAEELKRKRAEADQKMTSVIPALFNKMFGDSSDWSEKWNIKPLKEFAEMVSGATPTTTNEAYWSDAGTPWVSAKDMKTDFITSSMDHITAKALEDGRVKLIPEGSVLVVVRGMILAHTFPVSVNTMPVTINQDLKALIPKGMNGVFLWSVLQSMRGELLNRVKTAAHGTKKLDTNDLLQLKIPSPSLDVQNDFAERVKDILAFEEKQKRSALQIDSLFSSLLTQIA